MSVMKLLKRELDMAKYKARLDLGQMLISVGKWANGKAAKLLGSTKWNKELWEDVDNG